MARIALWILAIAAGVGLVLAAAELGSMIWAGGGY